METRRHDTRPWKGKKMKARKKWIAGIVLALFVMVTAHVTNVASEAERRAGRTAQLNVVMDGNQRDVLAGLEAVSVTVEEFPAGTEKFGLSREALQTDVELRLRQYGVSVCAKESLKPGFALLYVDVTPVIIEDAPLGAISVSVELKEAVRLLRSPTICVASTWSRGSVLLYGTSKLKEVRQDVKDLVDEFINDYLAANLKEESVKQAQETAHTNVTATSRGELWVKCNSPDCAAAYRISEQDYYQQIEERVKANPMALVTPALTCKRCGKESVYRAVQCEKCGHMFFYGNPNDFNDRCPKCGYSKMENERKKRTQGLPSTP
jgi:predicted Zn-ribbon and HTH transcriptional regulator